MEFIQQFEWLFYGILSVLALMLVLCLIRAVIGPRIADRLIAVNMMGTMVMVIISILSVVMNEGYLVDICLIYAMISFLAVIVLTKIYTGAYKKASVEPTEPTQEELESLLEEQKLFPERDLSAYGVVMPQKEEKEGGEA